MRRPSVIVFAFLLVIGTAACGASGGSDAGGGATTTTTKGDKPSKGTTELGKTTTTGGGDGAAYAAALAKGLTDESSGRSILKLDQKQAECVAPEWIDIIGTDTLKAKGVSPTDLEKPGFESAKLGLDEGKASAMIKAVDGCDVDAVKNLRTTIDADLDAGQKTCVAAELDDKTLQAVLVQSLYKDKPTGDLKAELDRIESTCKLTGTSGGDTSTTGPGN